LGEIFFWARIFFGRDYFSGENIFWAWLFFGGDYFLGQTFFWARLFFGRDYFSGETIFWARLFFGRDYFSGENIFCALKLHAGPHCFPYLWSPDHWTVQYCTVKSAHTHRQTHTDSLTHSLTHPLAHPCTDTRNIQLYIVYIYKKRLRSKLLSWSRLYKKVTKSPMFFLLHM
jgi:hypothetical protein